MSNNETIQAMLEKFLPFAQERMGFKNLPEIHLENDEVNAQQPLGKTAYYDPSQSSVTVYVDGRHPKDIMRSISHELVHHTQNGRGEFDKVTTVGEGYAQSDDHLRNMEKEAYTEGNLCFRDWEDSIKTQNEELNMFEKRNKRLNESIMKKFGYAEKESTEEKLDEGFFSKEPDWEQEADRINTDADAECEKLGGAFEKALTLNPYKPEDEEVQTAVRTNFSRKCSKNYKNRCEELEEDWKESIGAPPEEIKRARIRFQAGCPERADKFEKDNAELVKKLRHQGRDRYLQGHEPDAHLSGGMFTENVTEGDDWYSKDHEKLADKKFADSQAVAAQNAKEGVTLDAEELITLLDLATRYKAGDEYDTLEELENNQELMDKVYSVFGHECPGDNVEVAKCLMDSLVETNPWIKEGETLKRVEDDAEVGEPVDTVECPDGTMKEKGLVGGKQGGIAGCPNEEELEEAIGFDEDFGDEFDHLFEDNHEESSTLEEETSDNGTDDDSEEERWGGDSLVDGEIEETYLEETGEGCEEVEPAIVVTVGEGLYDNRNKLLHERLTKWSSK